VVSWHLPKSADPLIGGSTVTLIHSKSEALPEPHPTRLHPADLQHTQLKAPPALQPPRSSVTVLVGFKAHTAEQRTDRQADSEAQVRQMPPLPPLLPPPPPVSLVLPVGPGA
jgi:hypothetical protein